MTRDELSGLLEPLLALAPGEGITQENICRGQALARLVLDLITAEDSNIPPHSDRCYREATRDVIFLFMVNIGSDRPNVPVWHNEAVFLSREEANDWGRKFEYRWPLGWRVFGMCAEGQLAKLLKVT